MTGYELKDSDSGDIEDLLVKVETSFGIRFADKELVHITTFGQFCDHVTAKIQLEEANDCTSQQAFYKLRNALTSVLPADSKTIPADFPLADLLPWEDRRDKIKQLEKQVGFKLNLLRPPHWVTKALAIAFLASCVTLFFNWQNGLLGTACVVAGFWLANKTGNELEVQTVGQAAEKMTRENYLRSRRDPKTVNKREIEKILTDWFSQDLDIDKNNLTREAKFR